MYRGNWVRTLKGAIAAALTVIAWVAFAPVQIGGNTAFIVVNGVSMEPVLHRGDLAILRRSDVYRVQDVVVYQDPTVGRVIHRIVGQEGNRFVLKGDNNRWRDSFNPTQAEFLGKYWFFIPGAGTWVTSLRNPQALAVLVALVGCLGAAVFVRNQPGGLRHRRRLA